MDHRKQGITIMKKEVYEKIVDYIGNLKQLDYVTLTDFNEFFNTPELTSYYLPQLKKRGIPYVITSNGSLKVRNPEYYEKHPPKYIILGLQTITEKQYLSTGRLPERSWDKYLKSVAEFIEVFSRLCPSSLISIEVAINPEHTQYVLASDRRNQEIPNKSTQELHLIKFIKELEKITPLKFLQVDNAEGRYAAQHVLYADHKRNIIIAFKEFYDIKSFYENIPRKSAPICYSDQLTFDVTGGIKMCCIDFKGGTKFGSVEESSMVDLMERYIKNVKIMRTTGSPFEVCKACFGYRSNTDRIFSLRGNIKQLVKRSPYLLRMYKFVHRYLG